MPEIVRDETYQLLVRQVAEDLKKQFAAPSAPVQRAPGVVEAAPFKRFPDPPPNPMIAFIKNANAKEHTAKLKVLAHTKGVFEAWLEMNTVQAVGESSRITTLFNDFAALCFELKDCNNGKTGSLRTFSDWLDQGRFPPLRQGTTRHRRNICLRSERKTAPSCLLILKDCVFKVGGVTLTAKAGSIETNQANVNYLWQNKSGFVDAFEPFYPVDVI